MKTVFLLLWVLCFQLIIFLLLLPLALLVQYSSLSNVLLALLTPLTLIGGLLLNCLFFFVFYQLVPNYKPGNHRLFSEKNAILWAINNGPATIILKLFQSLFFLNDGFRFIILKSLGCNIQASSWITSNTHLYDLRHITIGKNTILGEFCFLSASVQATANRLRVKPICIGNNVLIGYCSDIGPGTVIQDNCHIGGKVIFTINNSIGANTSIGAGTRILPFATIGNNVKIGKGCTILTGAKIPDGTVIPSFTVFNNAHS